MAPERPRHKLCLLLLAALACSLHAGAAAASTSTSTLAIRHKPPSKPRHGNTRQHRPRSHAGSGMASCNMFQGSWVYDDALPMYDAAGCPFVEPEFDCQKYGRPDKLYLKYRWRPASCELPRYVCTHARESGTDWSRQKRRPLTKWRIAHAWPWPPGSTGGTC